MTRSVADRATLQRMDAEVAALLDDARTRADRYRASSSDRPVFPAVEVSARLAGLDGPLPEASEAAGEVIDRLDALGSPATVVTNGPRYFGFVTGGSLPVAAAAGTLAAAWDQNAAVPVMSPTAAALDRTAARWLVELLGLPTTSTATFCSGASVANLIGIVAGRDAVLARRGWDVPGQGLAGAPPITVITSEEAHVSVGKAVALAGLGRDRIVRVAADRQGRLDAGAFAETLAIHDDGPTIVILQAGNVNTGHSDPFSDVIEPARAAGAWVHVDGAFGLWAAAAPERSDQVAGVGEADSWATDAHKWLNVPYDCAIAIVRDGADLARSMRADAAYLPVDEGSRVPMHLGLQMSQRARAIEVWAVIASLGRSGIADLIERSCTLAARFAERLNAAGAEVLHDVVLNQVLVSFGTDDMTDAVIEAVQADGTCWVGGTSWHGHRAMRLSVSGWQTTEADVDASADAIVTCWSACGEQGRPTPP